MTSSARLVIVPGQNSFLLSGALSPLKKTVGDAKDQSVNTVPLYRARMAIIVVLRLFYSWIGILIVFS